MRCGCHRDLLAAVGGALAMRLMALVALVLLVIRPLSVALGLLGSRTSGLQRGLIGWFGIGGVGGMYYSMYAVNHGVAAEWVQTAVATTLAVVVTSIMHRISVTPLMARYRSRQQFP